MLGGDWTSNRKMPWWDHSGVRQYCSRWPESGAAGFSVTLSLSIKVSLGAQPFIWKWVQFACDWNLISISKMGTKTRFEKEANSNSEMAYCTHTTPASKKGNRLAYLHLSLNLACVHRAASFNKGRLFQYLCTLLFTCTRLFYKTVTNLEIIFTK